MQGPFALPVGVAGLPDNESSREKGVRRRRDRAPGSLFYQKKNQNIFKSFKKWQFFRTNTYAYSLSMYKFSVTNLIICMLHKKDKNLTQIQQRKSLFQSVYLSFLYTSHMNTYVYENLYTYTLSICLHENIFSDFFELWKRYFG